MRHYLTRTSNLVFLAVGTLLFASCEKEEKTGPKDEGPLGNKPPIELDCDYFREDRILVDDPEAPVDYLITCKMPIRADIKIEPGVVIEFEQDAGLDIDDFAIPKASLSAVGTSSKPIIFRGVKKEKGYWRGILFNSNSTSNELRHVQIEDAGGRAFNSNGDEGSVVVWAGATLKMENTTVSNSRSNGLNAMYSQSDIALKNNIFTGNKNPVQIAAHYIDILNPTNKFSGNEEDFIRINASGSSGGVSKASTWHKVDVPYQCIGRMEFKALVTIEPGVRAEFGQNFLIKVAENGGGIKAVGTAEEPIIFMGTSKVPKAWKGIYVESKHAENEIAFAEIHHSGMDAPTANVYLWYKSMLNIHDVKFKDIDGCGINYRPETGGAPNPNLTIGANITVEPSGCIENTY